MSSHLPPIPLSTPNWDAPTTPTHHALSSLANKFSPILNNTHTLSTVSSLQPQFAELLTPHKLRRRKHLPSPQSIPASIPLRAGPSDQGFYTDDGDLFRGAAADPTRHLAVVDDDTITLGGSSTTSSSSGGGLERGRRATMAVLERFGTVIGVRRASDSSMSTDPRSEGEMRSRRMSRTVSKDTLPGPSKRKHLPKKREFVLLLPPPKPSSNDGTPRDSVSLDETRRPMEYPPDRVIHTPTLSTVLDEIRKLRAASGMLPDLPGNPVSRSSRPRPKMPRGGSSFLAPPVPTRPTRSRLQTLREVQVRPKSVSDLIGQPNAHGTTPNLSSMGTVEYTAPSRAGSPSLASSKEDGKGKGKTTACWWLDVGCPGWEDLRDLGEVILNRFIIAPKLMCLAAESPPTYPRGCPSPGSTREARSI